MSRPPIGGDTAPGAWPGGHPMQRRASLPELNEVARLATRVDLLERQLAAVIAAAPPATVAAVADAGRASGGQGGGEVPMGATRVVVHQLVLPADADQLGICFGGTVLSWIDVAAGLAAKTLARGPVVTASVDAVHFLRPARAGSVAIVAATVNRVFRSSAEVGVRVEVEDMATGARAHCVSAYLTFVSLGRTAAGPAALMPPVFPQTAAQTAAFDAAAVRREARLAARAAARADPGAQPPRLEPITHRAAAPSLAPAVRPGAAAAAAAAARPRVPPAFTLAHMTQLIMPQHANSLGITFGGQVMRWMEQTAYIAASRVGRGGHLLTASMDGVAFAGATRVGDVMYVSAQVTAIWGASMEVLVSVCAETPSVGAVTECGDAFITVVLVDAKGAPLPVPVDLATPVDPAHPDARRARGAAARRDERLAMRAALSEKEARRPSLDGSVRGGGAAAAAAAALAGLGVTGDGDAAVEAAARAMERRFVDA